MEVASGQFDPQKYRDQEWSYGQPFQWSNWGDAFVHVYAEPIPTPEFTTPGIQQVWNYVKTNPEQALIQAIVLVILGTVIVAEAFEIGGRW